MTKNVSIRLNESLRFLKNSIDYPEIECSQKYIKCLILITLKFDFLIFQIEVQEKRA